MTFAVAASRIRSVDSFIGLPVKSVFITEDANIKKMADKTCILLGLLFNVAAEISGHCIVGSTSTLSNEFRLSHFRESSHYPVDILAQCWDLGLSFCFTSS